MTLKQRYQQAGKEASWALGLSILYVIGWCLCAYLPKGTQGPIGFPLWFELSCIYLPILFIVIGYWIIKIIFQDISLEINDQESQK
ncbi:YhdT family protein [Haemophilus influenzae]|nr:YhdT family protein [Haemophilus influenzae]